MVARKGPLWQVRLTDFGSGRLLESSRLSELGITRLGLTITPGIDTDSGAGTLMYLAPELLIGQGATMQSDVFALGLILYQLIVADLRKPWATGWERDISDPLLRDDIAAGTDGNPGHRLASATELASRVRTLGNRRATLARIRDLEESAAAEDAASRRRRARRPWQIALFGSSVIGFLVTLWLAHANHAAYLLAESEKDRAEAINRFLDEDLLGAADPGAPGGKSDATVADLLQRASARLQGRFINDPRTRASVDLALGDAYFGLSRYAEAESAQKQAIDLLEKAQGESGESTIEAEYALARTELMETRYGEAAALIAKADNAAGDRLQKSSPLTLFSLWSRADVALMQMQPSRALPLYLDAERVRVQVERRTLAGCFASAAISPGVTCDWTATPMGSKY